jgi:hypothetical protein
MVSSELEYTWVLGLSTGRPWDVVVTKQDSQQGPSREELHLHPEQ